MEANVCVKGKQNWLQWVIMLHGYSGISHDLLEVCLRVCHDLLALGPCGLFGFVVSICLRVLFFKMKQI